MYTNIFLLTVAAILTVCAQQPAYSQCGGQGFTGGTNCVSGYTCVASNPYYSQCIPSSQAGSSSKQTTTTSLRTTTTTTTKLNAPTSSASPVSGDVSYKASFTEYGAGDTFGSPNCQTTTTACGFYTTGYNAAISQNFFGVGPGAGAGPACGTCWKLTIETDSSGNKVSNAGNSIVVEVTNLCPAQGNPLCAQSGTSGTNQYGANVNFDTCIQSGASAALFGNTGVGLGLGTAQQVACNSQVGSRVG